jgi:hypothetical protein
MLATAEPGQERIASEKPSYRKLFFRGPGRLLRVRVVSAGSTPGAVHDAEVLAGAGASSRIARLVPQSEFAFAGIRVVRVREFAAFIAFAWPVPQSAFAPCVRRLYEFACALPTFARRSPPAPLVHSEFALT